MAYRDALGLPFPRPAKAHIPIEKDLEVTIKLKINPTHFINQGQMEWVLNDLVETINDVGKVESVNVDGYNFKGKLS